MTDGLEQGRIDKNPRDDTLACPDTPPRTVSASSEVSSEGVLRVLLIGPLPPPLGGATVSFKQLVDELSLRHHIAIKVVNTRSHARRRHLVAGTKSLLSMLYDIARYARHVDVLSLHVSNSGAKRISPYVKLISRLSGKPWLIRFFGGSIGRYYNNQNWLFKAVFRHTALSADLCLFQTRSLVECFDRICGKRARWYSNSRPLVPETIMPRAEGREVCSRFVFVGHVKPGKGIGEIIEAAEHLGDGISIDVFGPLMDGIDETAFAGRSAVKYRGVLPPQDVISTLRHYDALLMPTRRYEGEGYPGVILEALAAGLPVIASRWRASREVVDDTCGILVEPGDVEELVQAIELLRSDLERYRLLCEGARTRAKEFASERWTQVFVDYCLSLVSVESLETRGEAGASGRV